MTAIPIHRPGESSDLELKMVKLGQLHDAAARVRSEVSKRRSYETSREYTQLQGQIKALRDTLPKPRLAYSREEGADG